MVWLGLWVEGNSSQHPPPRLPQGGLGFSDVPLEPSLSYLCFSLTPFFFFVSILKCDLE